jgi:hypothetical protein
MADKVQQTAYLVQNKNAFQLEEGKSILIGRGDDVNIKVLDSRCSRHHAEVTFLYNHTEKLGKVLLCAVSFWL